MKKLAYFSALKTRHLLSTNHHKSTTNHQRFTTHFAPEFPQPPSKTAAKGPVYLQPPRLKKNTLFTQIFLSESAAGGFQDHADLGLPVGSGDEGGFVLAGREPDPGVEHRVVKASKGHGV
jgi:hypothetical protein